jgi:hypothetical protein
MFSKEKKKKQATGYCACSGSKLINKMTDRYRYSQGLWIRIRIGSGFRDFVDPDPYWESGSGSRGKKIKKFQ